MTEMKPPGEGELQWRDGDETGYWDVCVVFGGVKEPKKGIGTVWRARAPHACACACACVCACVCVYDERFDVLVLAGDLGL